MEKIPLVQELENQPSVCTQTFLFQILLFTMRQVPYPALVLHTFWITPKSSKIFSPLWKFFFPFENIPHIYTYSFSKLVWLILETFFIVSQFLVSNYSIQEGNLHFKYLYGLQLDGKDSQKKKVLRTNPFNYLQISWLLTTVSLPTSAVCFCKTFLASGPLRLPQIFLTWWPFTLFAYGTITLLCRLFFISGSWEIENYI